MPHVFRPTHEENLHEQVIRWLETHWNDPAKYNITTNPDGQQNRWVGSETNKRWPDIVAWVREGNRDRAVWIAEVETAATVAEEEARSQERDYAGLGVPLHLVVPSGSCPHCGFPIKGHPLDILSLIVPKAEIIYVGIEAGGLLYSGDDGRSFEPRSLGLHPDIHAMAVDAHEPARVYAATGHGFEPISR